MSREIRFRAWDNRSVKGHMMVVRSLQFNDFLNVNGGDPLPLMQYTGLRDKNGREIYEGDILRGSYDSAYEVRYMGDRDYPAFDVIPDVGSDSNGLSYLIAEESVEVIGNIYENPELLTKAAA